MVYSERNSKGKFVKKGIKKRTGDVFEAKKRSLLVKQLGKDVILEETEKIQKQMDELKLPISGLVIIDMEHFSKVSLYWRI